MIYWSTNMDAAPRTETVTSLLDTTAKFIGENARFIDYDSFSGLPVQVLEYILPYFSAANLHRLSSLLLIAGISINSLWKLHLQRRWSRLRPIMNIFHELEIDISDNFHKVYLMKHFFDLLKYCSISNSTDPHAVFHTSLHKLQKPWAIAGSVAPVDYENELLNYSHYVDSLKILGNQCSYVCSNQSLLKNLCQTVKRIQLHMVIDINYKYVRVLLLNLLQFGKLKQAIFSTVKLSYQKFNDLMKICSGLHEEKFQLKDLQIIEETETVGYSENVPASPCMTTMPVNRISHKTVSSPFLPENQFHSSGSSSTDTDFDLFDEAIAPNYAPFSENPRDDCPTSNTSEGRQEKCSCQSVKSNISGMCEHCDFDYEELEFNARQMRGLEEFALFSTNGISVGKNLEAVLPKWTSLKKIGILFNADIGSDVLMMQLVNKVRCHQLSHLVLDDVSVHEDMFEMLLQALVQSYRLEDSQCKPLELFDYQAAAQNIAVKSTLHPTAPLSAVVRIDLSMNTLEESGFEALLQLVKWDRALRQLKISGCYLRENQVISLLNVLTDTPQIEMLGLSGNLVQTDSAEEALIKFLNGVPTLQKLALNNCRLRSTFISEVRFVKAVKMHPKLSELSLKSNHLEMGGTKFLLDLFVDSPKSALRAVDIGYNWIKGQDLVSLAETLRAAALRSQVGSLPVLEYLNISGNRFTRCLQRQVRQMFRGLVRELDADTIDFTQPHAEHASQM